MPLDTEQTVTVLSHLPGRAASVTISRPSKRKSSNAWSTTATRSCSITNSASMVISSREKTVVVGLLGLVSSTIFVRGERAASSAARVRRKPFASSSRTETALPPRSLGFRKLLG